MGEITSILIPAREEKEFNLMRTIDSIYANAIGEFEIIIGFNGSVSYIERFFNEQQYPNLEVITFPRNVGIKININVLAAMATGKYLFKLDAHTAVGKGFDEILKADMQDDWIVMPRFKIIKDDWSIQIRDGQEEYYDYFYLCCPFTDPRGFRFKAGGHWKERTQERLESHPGVDETPQIHGSGWMMTKDRFFELGGFPLQDPYGHGQEAQWLALRNWLKGGKVMVNKKTWYAHLHQGNQDKGYHYTRQEEEYTYNWTARHFMLNKEPNLIHDMAWFVDTKFPNMPTWPSNWEELQAQYERSNP